MVGSSSVFKNLVYSACNISGAETREQERVSEVAKMEGFRELGEEVQMGEPLEANPHVETAFPLDPARASYLIQLVTGVAPFHGVRAELELFLARMDEVRDLVAAYPMDPKTARSIKGFMLSRVDISILIEVGATSQHSWEDVRELLRLRYGGTKYSIVRSALDLADCKVEPGEGYAAYARRLAEATRHLKGKVAERCLNAEERKWRNTLYEEMASERLFQTLPDRIRTWIQICVQTSDRKTRSVEELAQLVQAREQDLGGPVRERKTREEPWQEVTRRSRPRPPRRYFPGEQRTTPLWTKGPSRERGGQGDHRSKAREVRELPSRRYGDRRDRPGGAGTRPQPRPPPECWECGERGHFARECPYIFRRNRPERRTYAEAARVYEPMEVNATRVVRGKKWDGSSEESDDGSDPGAESPGGSEVSKASVRSYRREPGGMLRRREKAVKNSERGKKKAEGRDGGIRATRDKRRRRQQDQQSVVSCLYYCASPGVCGA